MPKMELLAPAGSKESFVAAIRAGADSVYMGIDKYNARLNADKLNIYDLEVLTDYAHSKNVKVYLALNTLIKHEEIYDVEKTLEKITPFKPDALIVQDLGMARIIREEFPELDIHASTQMAVHNSAGVEALAELGFKRVILARELSRSDLKLISSKSTIELEVFCHGALCFCVSGMCLFSSFIGSRSGNRGWCTQPCRRIWKNSSKQGYLFSPKDLELASEIVSLKKIGINSLKIEGRMRSSEYVYNVVRAYRVLIDSPEGEMEKAFEEAGRFLSMDWARSKTTLYFSGTNDDIFIPENAQCPGKNIGSVLYSDGTIVTLQVNCLLKKGDRIRISDPSNDITKTIKISQIKNDGNLYTLNFDEVVKTGTPVFKAGDADWDENKLTKEVDNIYHSYTMKTKPPPSGEKNYGKLRYPDMIARQWLCKQENNQERLWVKIDNIDWLEILPLSSKEIIPVLYISRENMYELKAVSDTLHCFSSDFACELTPYISQKEMYSYTEVVNAISESNIKFWVLNNIAHFKIVPDNAQKVSGHFLYTANAFTCRVLKDMGTKYFVTSWEDDFLNIKRVALAGVRAHLIVYLFGFPAIVRSRMIDTDYLAEAQGKIISRTNDSFTLKHESGSMVLLPSVPVMNFTAREKLASLGILNFGIDLCFTKPDKQKWKELFECYTNKKNLLLSATKFNFKRGIN